MRIDTKGRTREERRRILQGLHVAGRSILRNDTCHTLIVDGRLFFLPRSVYQVTLPLLEQRSRWERGQAPLWLSDKALLAASGITTDPSLVRRYINRANNELLPTGICFVRVPTYDGPIYQALLRDRDIQGERAG